MGSAISAVREEVKQGTDKGHEDIVNVLDTLEELAKTKADLFYADLLSVEKQKEYKVQKVQSLQLKTLVSVDEQSKVAEEVGKAVGNMMDGDWLKGIVSIFTTTLNTILGNGSGMQMEEKQFYVFVNGVGISRLDFYLYTRSIEFTQFSSKQTKVLVVGYAVSSINVKEMTRSDLNQIVSNKMFYDAEKEEITDAIALLKKQEEYVELIAKANGISDEERKPAPVSI